MASRNLGDHHDQVLTANADVGPHSTTGVQRPPPPTRDENYRVELQPRIRISRGDFQGEGWPSFVSRPVRCWSASNHLYRSVRILSSVTLQRHLEIRVRTTMVLDTLNFGCPKHLRRIATRCGLRSYPSWIFLGMRRPVGEFHVLWDFYACHHSIITP